MKRLILPLCVAATTALATPLKDPTVVARDWQLAAEETRQPLTPTGNLAAHSRVPTTPPLERIFGPDSLPSLPPPPSRPKHLDAPSTKIPDQLPNIRPRGAVPWEYNGEVYWLVPLGTPAGK